MRWHGRILGVALMSDAQDRGWGPPCPPRERIVNIFPGGLSRALPVHERVAGIFTAFVDELEARGYKVEGEQRDDWGFACRHIDDDPSKPWSNHAWGLAIDINAPINPRKAPLTTNMPAWVREAQPLMDKYGLRWGGHFHDLPDPMHFEFMLKPADADRISGRLGVGPALVPGGLSAAERRAILTRMEAIYDALREGSATNVNSLKHLRDHVVGLERQVAELKAEVAALEQPTG